MLGQSELRLRGIIKRELARLKEEAIAGDEIAGDLLLFDLYEDGTENLALGSLDALEFAMAIVTPGVYVDRVVARGNVA